MHLEGGGAEEYKAVNNGNSRARIKHFPTLRLFCLVMMELIRFGFFFCFCCAITHEWQRVFFVFIRTTTKLYQGIAFYWVHNYQGFSFPIEFTGSIIWDEKFFVLFDIIGIIDILVGNLYCVLTNVTRNHS